MDIRRYADAADLPHQLIEPPGGFPHTTRHRLATLDRDRRFESSYHVASNWEGKPLCAVPTSLARSEAALQDWLPPAFGSHENQQLDPERLVLLGARADLRSPVLASSEASTEDVSAALALLVRKIRADARQAGRTCLVPHTTPMSELVLAASVEGRVEFHAREPRFVIRDVGADQESFLETLPAGRRQVLRRDVRALDRLECTMHNTSWESVADWGVPAVHQVVRRHQPRSDERLTRFRLKQYMADPDSHRVAFVVESGASRSVSLGWRYGKTLELYELGVSCDENDEQLLYLGALIHAPLRYMWAEGLRRLDLSTEASRPKSLRGAIPLPAVCAVLR